MKRRAERNRDIETIKDSIFEAGVSVLNAAKANEELFDTSIKALAEAMDVDTSNSSTSIPVYSIREMLLTQQHEAELTGDIDAFIKATEKIEFLEELEVKKLEREARKLEAQIRIETAKQQLGQVSQETSESIKNGFEKTAEFKTGLPIETANQTVDASKDSQWTEAKLKKKFNTLSNARKALGQEAKSWKEAVKLANQVPLS